MSYTAFISETGFKIQNSTSDIADLATSWSSRDEGGNRVLNTTTGGSGDGYSFPTLGKGFNNLVNGQIVTIFNRTGTSIIIYSGNATVYVNGNAVNSFAISDDRAVMFVYINNQYFAQISDFKNI
jgi:hypothetical protein